MKRMQRMPTRKSHSWWWDSHISPKNSKWLAENLEEMDKQVKEMLKLIEDEGDSFAKKAEMYYQRRPLLVTHVENFYRMYRALAERYDNVTGELRKNLPSSLQSQGSGISETDSETQSTPPSPEPKMEQKTKQKRKTGAAGADVLLGSGGSSDISKKGSDGSSSSSSDSDSEVDEVTGENGNGFSYELNGRIAELEEELQETRQQLEEKSMSCQCEKLESFKQVSIEKEELISAAKHYEAQLTDCDHEIEKCKQELEQVSEKYFYEKSTLEVEIRKLEESVKNLEGDVERVVQEKSELLEDKASLEGKLASTEAQLEQLHAEKAEASLESEKQISKLHQAIADLKAKLETLSSEKSAADSKVSVLLIDVAARDEKTKEMDSHLFQLHLEHVKLIEEADAARKAISDMRARVCELEEEVEKLKLVISDSAEGKREAIRQLCFSLDHYRHGYQQLRQLLHGHKRPTVMAT